MSGETGHGVKTWHLFVGVTWATSPLSSAFAAFLPSSSLCVGGHFFSPLSVGDRGGQAEFCVVVLNMTPWLPAWLEA